MTLHRRDVLALGALMGGGMSPAVAAEPPTAPQLVWEFTARLQWANGRNPTGVYAGGHRIYNVVAGGDFAGPRLRGEILPGGGDWATMNPPDADLARAEPGRAITYDARYILRTDDGVHIYVLNRGGKFTEAGDDAGGPPRTTPGLSQPMFDAPIGGRYAFLSRNVYVGVSQAMPDHTILQVFRVAV